MNLSKELELQLDRFGKMRSMQLNKELKEEMVLLHESFGWGKLNKDCSTCVRICADKLNNKRAQEKEKFHFVGIKQSPEMTFNEMKAEAKNRGIPVHRNTNKNDLIELLFSNK
jgi:hypothetical protein